MATEPPPSPDDFNCTYHFIVLLVLDTILLSIMCILCNYKCWITHGKKHTQRNDIGCNTDSTNSYVVVISPDNDISIST